MARGKKYKKVASSVDRAKVYNLDEAVALLPTISTSSFKGSLNLHVKLNLSEKQKNESIKGSVQLPHQVGEPAKILVITTPEHQKEAEGADYVGGEEIVKKIQGGWEDFDIVIATPDIMPKIAMLGKVLGPKGLMPNPKSGTVTTDIKATVASYKKGKIDFRMDKQGGIHQTIGKSDMTAEQIKDNILAFMDALFGEIRKFGANPIKSIFIAPTMGPSIKLDSHESAFSLT